MKRTERYMQFEERVRDILIQGTRPDRRRDVEEYFGMISCGAYESANKVYATKLVNGFGRDDVPLESIAALGRAMIKTEQSIEEEESLGISRLLYDIVAEASHHHDRELIKGEIRELDKFKEHEAA